jgi:hypothetical protein
LKCDTGHLNLRYITSTEEEALLNNITVNYKKKICAELSVDNEAILKVEQKITALKQILGIRLLRAFEAKIGLKGVSGKTRRDFPYACMCGQLRLVSAGSVRRNG